MSSSEYGHLTASVTCKWIAPNQAELTFTYGESGSTALPVPVEMPTRRAFTDALGRKLALDDMCCNSLPEKRHLATLVFKDNLGLSARSRFEARIKRLLTRQGFDPARINCIGFPGASTAVGHGD